MENKWTVMSKAPAHWARREAFHNLKPVVDDLRTGEEGHDHSRARGLEGLPVGGGAREEDPQAARARSAQV